MFNLFTNNMNELMGRVYLGYTYEESKSKMKFFYLNHDESEFERWDTQLLHADGKPGLSLTYGIKEFMISFSVKKTRSSDLYIARFSNMKRKVLENVNEILLSISFEKFELNGYTQIKSYDMKVNWEKGRPLHDVWTVLADSLLEDFLGIKNGSENLLLEGRLLKN